jgi:hypothetical protein
MSLSVCGLPSGVPDRSADARMCGLARFEPRNTGLYTYANFCMPNLLDYSPKIL